MRFILNITVGYVFVVAIIIAILYTFGLVWAFLSWDWSIMNDITHIINPQNFVVTRVIYLILFLLITLISAVITQLDN